MPQLLVRDLALDFVLEAVLGTPAELWLGEPDESPVERAARLDAAADILDDVPDGPGADFLRDLLFEDGFRPVEFVAPGEPGDADEDIEWLEGGVMDDATVKLSEDQRAYVDGLIDLAAWLEMNPDAIPEFCTEKLLLSLSTNAAVQEFAARHGLAASYNGEGNASVDLEFGPVTYHAYGYADFAESWKRQRQRDAESFAAEHGLALISTAEGES